MKPTSMILNITSDQPEVLQRFYEDVVGLERDPVSCGYVIGDALFAVDGHSETHGRAKEPSRFLFSFQVEDAQAERERLEARGVQFIRKEGQEFWGGKFSTFIDPDGNYAQLMEFHPEEQAATATAEAHP